MFFITFSIITTFFCYSVLTFVYFHIIQSIDKARFFGADYMNRLRWGWVHLHRLVNSSFGWNMLLLLAIVCIYLVCIYRRLKKTRVILVTPSKLKPGDSFYTEEKAMPNSTYEHTKVLPSFQAMIMASLDGETYHVMGQCFWVDEGLVTAAHVIEGFNYLIVYRDDDHKVQVDPDSFEIGHGDYAVIRQPQRITQLLGLSKAKFVSIATSNDSGLSVNITAMEKRTIGFLERHNHFGFVSYTGSTTKGFSGAPYYFGRTIFGMHLGADSKNMGYDGAYLRTELRPSRVIKKQTGLDTEDSAEWLIGQLDRYEEIEYSRSPYNPDEYKVRVGNQYHIVDDEVMEAVLKHHRSKKHRHVGKVEYLAEAISSDGVRTEPTSEANKELAKEKDPVEAMVKGIVGEFGKTSIYLDQSPPKNVEDLPLAPRNAMTFEDSGNLIRAPPVDVGARGMVKHLVVAPNQGKQTCDPMDCTCRQPLVSYHMESRKSTHAPQNEASSRTVRNKNRRIARQAKKKELEQYKLLYGPIQLGDVTSQVQPTQTDGLTKNLTKLCLK
uniref:Peptidase S39 domain-containing protein n=1 Tax=Yongsan sobemo-like virus 1 TaxID=2315808 RepID=A0A385FQF8_9VIRU|nr:hypothetical protein 1 [Yongsan sobemo-like virus 1]